MRTATLAAILLAPAMTVGAQEGARYALRSPDGRVELTVDSSAADPAVAATPRWSLSFAGAPILGEGALGLVTVEGTELLQGAQVEEVTRDARDERVPMRFGKASEARDAYGSLRLALRGEAGVRVDLIARCYDDALALRYEVPEQAGLDALQLADEATAFAIAGEWTGYVQYLPHHRTSHEHPIERVLSSELAVGALIDLPVTFERAGGGCFAITEASLRGYAGLALRRARLGGPLVAALSPRSAPSGDGVADRCKVRRALPFATPWRVVLVGEGPGALLESTTIHCLNDPPAFDTAWIAPGKITWPWWNGYLFEAERGAPILSLETSRAYIDFCAQNGIGYHAVVADEADSPWYHPGKPGLFPGPETDATRVRADLDLPGIKSYADEHGVGLWTWVHHGAVRGRVEEVFAAFERVGWDGVMVDFLDRDDQETVEFAEEVLASAARHHVLVHFHGMAKPTGLSRTFPNLMNHEGALNLEYLKWSDRCTPEHDLRVAFTRLLAGPVDYHLGGFRAVPRAKFAPKNVAPNVLGTRCHQLALYVCFDNPAPMVADYPAAYRDAPGFEFVREVPTWWDETRVLRGEIGALLVTARRKGTAWYLGGLAAGAARELALPLAFLGDGRFVTEVWEDAPDCDEDPNRLARRTTQVTAEATLQVRLATDGGFVARLVPATVAGAGR